MYKLSPIVFPIGSPDVLCVLRFGPDGSVKSFAENTTEEIVRREPEEKSGWGVGKRDADRTIIHAENNDGNRGEPSSGSVGNSRNPAVGNSRNLQVFVRIVDYEVGKGSSQRVDEKSGDEESALGHDDDPDTDDEGDDSSHDHPGDDDDDSFSDGGDDEFWWHCEGEPHERIMATALYVLQSDSRIKGGDLRFKKAASKSLVLSHRGGKDCPDTEVG
jgi:hypothetical protein